jgi:hypothetical protein
MAMRPTGITSNQLGVFLDRLPALRMLYLSADGSVACMLSAADPSTVTGIDARDESEMGHILFFSTSLKDSCLNATGKMESWQQ